MTEKKFTHEPAGNSAIGEALSVPVPPEYENRYRMFARQVMLLSGSRKVTRYSTREDLAVDAKAWDRSSDSLIEGFMWALSTPNFADGETQGDDRAQEIGNMISFALTCGLTEGQVMECYKIAYDHLRSQN